MGDRVGTSAGPARGRFRSIVGAVVLLGLAGPARGLDPSRALTQFSLDVWRTADGLPQNTVQDIVQTRDGYLWLATQEGLVRYDGLVFTVFDTSNTAIPRNFIESIHEARDGALWFGTFHGGVTRYSGGTFRTYTTRDGLSANGATAIAEEPDGTLWFATLDSGLNRFQNGKITVYGVAQGLPDERVLSLHWTRDGSLWIGTQSGLARLHGGRFTVFTRKDGLPDDIVSALAEGNDGCVWVGTHKGLSCFRQGRFTSYGSRKGMPNAEIQVLRVDSAGALWIGTGGGLSRFYAGEFQSFTSREGLAQDIVLALAPDREGSLWIGTDGGGLNRFKDGKVVTFVSRDARWQPAANTVVGDGQGGLWVGAYGGQITRLQGGTFTILPSDPLKQSIVRALARDGNDLWIGTELGLSLHRGGGIEFLSGRDGLPVTSVRAILHDRQGFLWVGTDGDGVARRQGNNAFALYGEREGLAGNRVRAIHEDRQGRVWIGTYGGLSLFQDGRFTNFGAAQGLSDPLVRALYDDAAGSLWVGTFGGGLFRLRDGRFDAWTMREGLPSDTVYGITEDGSGHLWISCNRGIFRVAKAELEAVAAGSARAVHPRLFGVGDGMKSNECNGGNPAVWKDEQGGLFFPTIDGVVRVDPDRLPRNEVPPSVVVEQVLANGRPLEGGQEVTVPPGRPRVEIRFAGVSFLAPEGMEMAYRLEGFDRDWIDAGARRVATYTNLPPGRYTLHVRASNDDGVAATEASLALRVEPRFYETSLFQAACVGALALAGFGAHRLRVAGLKREERELKEKVAEGLASVKVLSGLLPVCASCKKIRDDKGYWNQIETYIHEHSEAQFSHGICPDCARRLYPGHTERRLGPRSG